MGIYTICFSPTGGTKKVLEVLASVWEEKAVKIDLSQPAVDFGKEPFSFDREDICLIGVPSFGGRVPAAALENLKQLKGGESTAILVVSFGNRAYDDTLLELRDAAVKCGFHAAAAIAAVTEHSIMVQYGAGRPDEQDMKQLLQFAGKIKEKIESGQAETAEASLELKVPGNIPYRAYGGVPLKPKADNEKCTRCGICAARCPVPAIPADHPEETDAELCISCMRCITVCPVHARSLDEVMLAASAQMMSKVCSERKENELYLI